MSARKHRVKLARAEALLAGDLNFPKHAVKDAPQEVLESAIAGFPGAALGSARCQAQSASQERPLGLSHISDP